MDSDIPEGPALHPCWLRLMRDGLKEQIRIVVDPQPPDSVYPYLAQKDGTWRLQWESPYPPGPPSQDTHGQYIDIPFQPGVLYSLQASTRQSASDLFARFTMRSERLQEITKADIRREGIHPQGFRDPLGRSGWGPRGMTVSQ